MPLINVPTLPRRKTKAMKLKNVLSTEILENTNKFVLKSGILKSQLCNNNQPKQTTIAMKKVIAVFAVIACVFTMNQAKAQGAGKVIFQDIHFVAKVVEGSNTVPIPNGLGTLRFVLRGGQIGNVTHQDATGKITRLSDTEPGSTENNPTPNPECKWEEHCVYNKEQGTAVCFCTPDVIKSNEPTPVGIGMLLPAVQKVREAAARTN